MKSVSSVLRDMRENVNWDREADRRRLLRRLFHFMLRVRAGREQVPIDLGAVFSKREMDRLLSEAVLGGGPRSPAVAAQRAESGLDVLQRVVLGGRDDLYDEAYLRAIFDRRLGRRDGFFSGWALMCFQQLTRWRLPPRACRLNVDKMQLEDRWNLCVAATRPTDLEIFHRLCGTVDDWALSQDRYEFLRRLDPLIEDWKGRLPDLRATLGKTIVDQLLIDSMYCHCEGRGKKPTKKLMRFVEFVYETGYRDQPKLDEDGKPVTRLATAVHHAHRCAYDGSIIDQLFKIYDKFEVDYEYEYITHYHVARESKCQSVAKMFREAKLARLRRERLNSLLRYQVMIVRDG
ncbi:unnamed protein product [Trichogramma brassicae]|uniref:Uncharacterized protein n=1 Tax=Trichogramma brassicae TaxID=86971 RepID=A0A6H5HZE9_9HYME|nr:unnamed protein product [Trichogramma brassicae]